ncbi:MAG TPA: FAD-dependent oxidoreductase [Acidimicrobiia bacterium]|nr:FAD-dependent oxidoreductase [Acidimicrobiia bacterium]
MNETKPVIIAVDDEPEVVQAVQRDLRARYSSDYRIVWASGGQEAIETLRTLALQGTPVALMLVDQRMPAVTGIDVLRDTLDIHPGAKRALLTAYADTEAAIRAINDVGLDHYIMKPWDPPEEKLYPILDDLLEDWLAGYRPRFDGLRVIGQQWSRDAHNLKAFLARNQIPYRSMDIESDPMAWVLTEEAGATMTDLPIVLFGDGPPIFKPTPAQIADRVGLKIHATSEVYDVVIIGGGPAGLAAAVYGASEGLATLLIEGEAPGGQAGQSSLIENYLGFPKGLSGNDLARRATAQAQRLGAEIIVPGTVTHLTRNDPFIVVHLADGSDITCKAMVIASGVSYRKLTAEGLEPLIGAGVYYGTSNIEAANHRDQPMYVVGGGNSAGQASLFLSRFTDSVTILIRDDDLSSTMSQYLIDNIDANPAVNVRPNSQVLAARGDTHLTELVLRDRKTQEEEEVEAGALFIFIGQTAHTEWLADLVQLDERGFILTGEDLGPLKGWTVERDPLPLETSVPGIFAAGDVRHGSIKRVAGAVGEGATAIKFIHNHLAAL